MSQLAVKELHAHYDKSHILHGVTFEIGSGVITSLLGRNGSGRSTLLKALMGILRPTGGAVVFDDIPIGGLKAHQIARHGLAYVPEDRLVFPQLSVIENLLVGSQPTRPGAPAWTLDDMYAYFPRLKERRDQRAGTLSGGEQQMLTLCRSLMGNPKLILVDEPTEGLAPAIVEQLREILVDMRRRGLSILLVEQKLTLALSISDSLLVMGRGQIVYRGSVAQFQSDDAVRKKWLDVS